MFVEIGGVRIGTDVDANMVVASAGVENWYSTPAAKTEFVERNGATGSYETQEQLFSSKTVVMYFHVLGENRLEIVNLYNFFNRLAAEPSKLRVSDDGHDTFVEKAYLTTAMPATFLDKGGTVVVTAQIPNPVRYSQVEQRVQLNASARSGAFEYDVEYPIDYGNDDGPSASGSVANAGTFDTAPVVTVEGRISGGFTLLGPNGRVIVYRGEVYPGTPVIVDCKRRVVLVNGQNVTPRLTRREWFSIPAGGSVTVTLTTEQDLATGQAWATLAARDAYI